MKCTSEELIFFSSIISKNNLFGVELEVDIDENRDSFIRNMLEQLRVKRLIKKDNKLSIPVIQMLEAIADYKRSQYHIILNSVRIALVGDLDAVAIYQSNDNEYEVIRIPRIAIALTIITQYPFLQKAKEEIAREEKIVSKSRMLRILREEDSEKLIVREYNEDISQSEILYRMDMDGCVQYNLKTGESKKMTSPEVRKALIAGFQISEERYGR